MTRKIKNHKEETIICNIISDMHENELEKIYGEIVIDEIELSDGFHKKMQLLESKMHKRNHRKTVLRVALSAVACMTIVFLLVFPGHVASASRYAIKWFKDHIGLQFSASSPQIDAIGYQLSYVPDGYTLQESDVGEKSGYYLFSNDRNEEMCFYYVYDDAAITMDYDDSLFQTLMFEDGRILYISKSENDIGGISVVWQSQDGSTEFTINSDALFTDEELIKIINGVETIEKLFQ